MQRLCILLIVLGLVLSGCASSPPATTSKPASPPVAPQAPARYSANEGAKLGLCMSMADNAMTIASYKLAGKSIDEVKQQYAGRPASALTGPLVDKIYGEHVSNAWDYTVVFYRDCAVNIASVQAPRSDIATYCMQNVMIATTAHSLKESGAPKETAYERFAKMGATPRGIVDDVYGQTAARADVVTRTWNSCMNPFTNR